VLSSHIDEKQKSVDFILQGGSLAKKKKNQKEQTQNLGGLSSGKLLEKTNKLLTRLYGNYTEVEGHIWSIC